jgi:hypothetical protein
MKQDKVKKIYSDNNMLTIYYHFKVKSDFNSHEYCKVTKNYRSEISLDKSDKFEEISKEEYDSIGAEETNLY